METFLLRVLFLDPKQKCTATENENPATRKKGTIFT